MSDKNKSNLSQRKETLNNKIKTPIKLEKKSHKKFYRDSKRHDARPSKTFDNSSTEDENSTNMKRIKSSSWKRSDSSIVKFNGKKKKLRPRQSHKIYSKIDDKLNKSVESHVSSPSGILYSEVLSGGSPSITTHNTPYMASGLNNECPVIDPMKDTMFPSLHDMNNWRKQIKIKKSETPNKYVNGMIAGRVSPQISENIERSQSTSIFANTFQKNGNLDPSVMFPNYIKFSTDGNDTEVIIESDSNNPDGKPLMSYGSYLEQKPSPTISLTELKEKDTPLECLYEAARACHFSVNIPHWNFTEIDTSPQGFPRFTQQFDDNHYLETEILAMKNLNLNKKSKD
ncbi:uncharacterized protein LOC142229404 [Haematobia irritans]|uniref:uncharacterized protein LOC142229404 n=1 Tax=Haematobia irritans TaxID=7368 RepID=UPI003F4F6B8C